MTVVSRVQDGFDSYGEPIWEESRRVVDDVLVAPAGTDDLTGSTRTYGDKTVIDLYFPKTFSGDLRGADVVVRGQVFRVEGDPFMHTPANIPTRWWIEVRAVLVDG